MIDTTILPEEIKQRITEIELIGNIDTYDKAIEAAALLSSLGLNGKKEAVEKSRKVLKESLEEEGINFKGYKYLCYGIVSVIEDKIKEASVETRKEFVANKSKVPKEVLEDFERTAVEMLMKPYKEVVDLILSRYAIGNDVEFGEEYTVYNFSDTVKFYLHRKEYKGSLVVEGEVTNRIDLNDFDTKEFYKWIKQTEKEVRQK